MLQTGKTQNVSESRKAFVAETINNDKFRSYVARCKLCSKCGLAKHSRRGTLAVFRFQVGLSRKSRSVPQKHVISATYMVICTIKSCNHKLTCFCSQYTFAHTNVWKIRPFLHEKKNPWTLPPQSRKISLPPHLALPLRPTAARTLLPRKWSGPAFRFRVAS